MTQNAAILDYLSDGQARTVREIHAACGTSRLNSRASELRKKLRASGYDLVCRRRPGVKVASDAYEYQIVPL